MSIKNAKLKIKNGELDGAVEDERNPIKSGADAGCAVLDERVDGDVREINSAAGGEGERTGNGEKAHKRASFQFQVFSFQQEAEGPGLEGMTNV